MSPRAEPQTDRERRLYDQGWEDCIRSYWDAISETDLDALRVKITAAIKALAP